MDINESTGASAGRAKRQLSPMTFSHSLMSCSLAPTFSATCKARANMATRLPARPVSARQMKIGNYFLERTIGKGNFAVVKLATHCDTQQKVAIKIIDKSRLQSNDHQKLEREIAVMKSLVHPYIIRLYEVMESKNLIYLVTEYADNGELLDLLLREKRLSEAKAKEKFRQLLLAVEYIHSKNIVHRDLKAENLLLDAQGNIKVADFGFANIFETNGKLQTFCGSPPYAAPELFQSLPYSPEKVDVWSLGVLLYIFVCGHLPFDSQNLSELRKQVLSGQLRLPFYLSTDCSSLISHMLTTDPEQRYTIEKIKNHPWLRGDDASEVELTIRTPTIPNGQLTNAILDQAELLGYDRQQILKSVNGNSYDSDAAIWHLLLEKFQKTCQIQHPQERIDPPALIDHSLSKTKSPVEIEILTDDEHDEELTSQQLREYYDRTHHLRRHTVARPDELTPIQLPTIESSVLPEDHHSYGCCSKTSCLTNAHSPRDHRPPVHLPLISPPEVQNNPWLCPPVSHSFHVNRRASDSGAHIRFFQQQPPYDLDSANHRAALVPSSRSSRASITRGSPMTPPSVSINDEHDEDRESLERYLNGGKRHTMCEQGVILSGRVRRSVREAGRERQPLSRRASDITSQLINGSARAHLERLYNNTICRPAEEDDLTTSSLQELHQLQRRLQKYSNSNPTDSATYRRVAPAVSPTSSLSLHIIREEQQLHPPMQARLHETSSSSSSSEALSTISDDMDCDVHSPPVSVPNTVMRPINRRTYYHHKLPFYHCHPKSLFAQHLAIPSSTAYLP